MAIIGGSGEISIDGMGLTLGGTLSLNTANWKYEVKSGLSPRNGTIKTKANPTIKLEALTTPELNVDAFQSVVEKTITVTHANGWRYTFYKATFTGDPEQAVHDGTVSFEYTAESCKAAAPR